MEHTVNSSAMAVNSTRATVIRFKRADIVVVVVVVVLYSWNLAPPLQCFKVVFPFPQVMDLENLLGLSFGNRDPTIVPYYNTRETGALLLHAFDLRNANICRRSF